MREKRSNHVSITNIYRLPPQLISGSECTSDWSKQKGLKYIVHLRVGVEYHVNMKQTINSTHHLPCRPTVYCGMSINCSSSVWWGTVIIGDFEIGGGIEEDVDPERISQPYVIESLVETPNQARRRHRGRMR